MEKYNLISKTEIKLQDSTKLKKLLHKKILDEEKWRKIDSTKDQENFLHTHYKELQFSDLSGTKNINLEHIYQEYLIESNKITSEFEVRSKNKFLCVFVDKRNDENISNCSNNEGFNYDTSYKEDGCCDISFNKDNFVLGYFDVENEGNVLRLYPFNFSYYYKKDDYDDFSSSNYLSNVGGEENGGIENNYININTLNSFCFKNTIPNTNNHMDNEYFDNTENSIEENNSNNNMYSNTNTIKNCNNDNRSQSHNNFKSSYKNNVDLGKNNHNQNTANNLNFLKSLKYEVRTDFKIKNIKKLNNDSVIIIDSYSVYYLEIDFIKLEENKELLIKYNEVIQRQNYTNYGFDNKNNDKNNDMEVEHVNTNTLNSTTYTNHTQKINLVSYPLISVIKCFDKICWLDTYPITYISDIYLNTFFFVVNNNAVNTFKNKQITGIYELKIKPQGGAYFNDPNIILLFSFDLVFLLEINSTTIEKFLFKHNNNIDYINTINETLFSVYNSKSITIYDINNTNQAIKEVFLGINFSSIEFKQVELNNSICDYNKHHIPKKINIQNISNDNNNIDNTSGYFNKEEINQYSSTHNNKTEKYYSSSYINKRIIGLDKSLSDYCLLHCNEIEANTITEINNDLNKLINNNYHQKDYFSTLTENIYNIPLKYDYDNTLVKLDSNIDDACCLFIPYINILLNFSVDELAGIKLYSHKIENYDPLFNNQAYKNSSSNNNLESSDGNTNYISPYDNYASNLKVNTYLSFISKETKERFLNEYGENNPNYYFKLEYQDKAIKNMTNDPEILVNSDQEELSNNNKHNNINDNNKKMEMEIDASFSYSSHDNDSDYERNNNKNKSKKKEENTAFDIINEEIRYDLKTKLKGKSTKYYNLTSKRHLAQKLFKQSNNFEKQNNKTIKEQDTAIEEVIEYINNFDLNSQVKPEYKEMLNSLLDDFQL